MPEPTQHADDVARFSDAIGILETARLTPLEYAAFQRILHQEQMWRELACQKMHELSWMRHRAQTAERALIDGGDGA